MQGGKELNQPSHFFPLVSFQLLEIKLRINLNGKETPHCLGYLRSPCNLDTTHFHLLPYFSKLDETLKTIMQNRKAIFILEVVQLSLGREPVAH